MYVAASPVASGVGFELARMFPRYAREAKLNGLFASRALRSGERVGEYRGEQPGPRGPRGRSDPSNGSYHSPYALQLSDGSLIEPGPSCAARYANFARTRHDANAELVEELVEGRGGRVTRAFLVATRRIAPHTEILTLMAHDPPVHPQRDAQIAYAHFRRARHHRDRERETATGSTSRAKRHERRGKRYARRALRAIGEANDLAFGARTKQTARKGAGVSPAELELARVRDVHRSEAACAARIEDLISRPRLLLGGIPNPGDSEYANSCFINAALQCLFAIREVTFEDRLLRGAYDAIKRECSTGKPASLATALAFRAEALRAMDESEPHSAGVAALRSAIQKHKLYDVTEFLSPLLALVAGCTGQVGQAGPSPARAECPFELAWMSRVSRVLSTTHGPVESIGDPKTTRLRILDCPTETADGNPILDVSAAVRAKMSPHYEGAGWTMDKSADGSSRRTDYESQTTSYWIRSFPAILCISLSRFKMVSAVTVKVTHGIPLCPELRLSYNANVAVYDLIAIAAHEGRSATTGHYTAYTKRSRQGATVWAKYDDATVSPLSERRALAACRATAYAIFYRLRGILATPAPPPDAERSSSSDHV